MRVTPWIIPGLIILAIIMGTAAARLITFPSVTLEYQSTSPPADRDDFPMVVMSVRGVRCVDTARRAGLALKDLEGVLRFQAYASTNKIEVTYDPEKVTVQKIRETIEGPIFDEATGEILFNTYQVLEINGREVFAAE